jgi:hypothetical protein
MDPQQAQPAPQVINPALDAVRIAAFNDGRAQAAADAQVAMQENVIRIRQLEAQVIAARKVKLPTFYSGSGKKDEPTLNNWVSSMEVHYRAAKVFTVQEQLELAGACLSGTAVDWFNKVFWPTITIDTTWNDFVDALRKRFEPVDSETTARARLNNLRQGKYSVTSYTNMFTDIIGRVGPMNDKDQYEHYVNGLRKDIADALRIHMVGRSQQLAVAMALAFEIENALSRNNANEGKGVWRQWRRGGGGGGGNNRYNTPTTPSNPFALNHDGPVPMELGHISDNVNDGDGKRDQDDDAVDDVKTPISYSLAAMQQHNNNNTVTPPYTRTPLPKLSDADRAKLRASGSCFRCRLPGHLSRDCPLQYNRNNNNNNRPKA